MERLFCGSEEAVWVQGDRLTNHLISSAEITSVRCDGNSPGEWGQNYQREQIISQQPHHTTRKQKRREWCRRGKSVRKCDFCNIHRFYGMYGFFLNHKVFENQWGYSPHCPTARPPSLFFGCAPWVFQRRTNIPRGISDPTPEGGLCLWVGSETPPPRHVWFSKQQCRAFKSYFLSIH